MKTLTSIATKYSGIEHNEDNFFVGGGLSDCGKKASNRHEDALYDSGKLTLGKAVQMFKKATKCEIEHVKEIINFAVPCMEWHHAGYLPKQYGGGMKKTYFLNAGEIVMLATKWEELEKKLQARKESEIIEKKHEKDVQELKSKFLKKWATRVERVRETPKYFYETDREMNGKYGWFSSYGKSYNMTEYYSGWAFRSEKKMREFFSIE